MGDITVDLPELRVRLACLLEAARLISTGMPATITPADITKHVQKLLEERNKYAEAIEAIDQTLRQIEQLLSQKTGQPTRGRPRAANAVSNRSGRRLRFIGDRGTRRTRRRFPMSGEESVLQFIKKHGNPTTQQVKAYWASAGRGGTADNVLTKLVKGKKLKRKPLEGERGSRYELV